MDKENKLKIDDLDIKLIKLLQEDIPLVERPFLEISKKLNITEKEVISWVKKSLNSGLMRRFGARISHRKIGINANPMIAWKIPESRVEECGNILAKNPDVTHCYERATSDEWPYNIYTMIHCKSKSEADKIAKSLSDQIKITDYILLYSIRELKKTHMAYFTDKKGK
ncbi:transcriptional regulator, AsnC family [Thermodesulfobium acidiphilum]|uniref:siroheme decarboxylase n=1 Tax=Thermodesulfobium acidiphilum TaxID=1794699 RepID=A0A2R4W215_THEAF|nr:AsnC family transcriptional regulator [Thermodesulfobium acidiphilum]AWB10732.1 transcriptional regulator, AsnC family [Thermodesulfobium acidiphilum]PMP85193.1 MAG: Lrp/AsnC family transcriptional regulator [Thermodesulfobium narugense]